MNEISYLEILKQAFFVTWKNKFLWFFGFVIFLGSLVSNINVGNNGALDQLNKIDFIANIAQKYQSITSGLVLVFIVFVIVLFFLKFVAKAAIIKSVSNIDLYRQLSLRNIFFEAKQYFWKLALLEVLISLTLGVIVAVLAVPVVYLYEIKAGLPAVVMTGIAILIVFPLVVLAFYLIEYGSFFLVLSDAKIRIALEFAYFVFKKNTKKSLIMGLITILLACLLLVVIVVSAICVLLVSLPLGLAIYFAFPGGGVIINIVVISFFEILMVSIVASWYAAFLQAAWLLFFQGIALEKQKEEKIEVIEKAEGEIPTPEAV